MSYLLEILVWQKSKDAQKRAPSHKPKPFVPPFMEKPKDESPINRGMETHTPDDMRDLLARKRV